MKKIKLGIFLGAWALGCNVWAGNTNIYEKDEVKSESFTAKVQLVKEESYGADVSFVEDVKVDAKKDPNTPSHSGYYALNKNKLKDYTAFYDLLEKSRHANGPLVKITAEKDERGDNIIKSVALADKAEKAKRPSVTDKDIGDEVDKVMKGH